MILEIITPENKLFEGEVTSVKFPGTDGEFGVLNNHAPIISTLTKGKIIVTDENGTYIGMVHLHDLVREGITQVKNK